MLNIMASIFKTVIVVLGVFFAVVLLGPRSHDTVDAAWRSDKPLFGPRK